MARRSHLTSYETHIRTPRGSVARLRLNIASPPRTRELRQRACVDAQEGRTRGPPVRRMFLPAVGLVSLLGVWWLEFTSLALSPVLPDCSVHTQ